MKSNVLFIGNGSETHELFLSLLDTGFFPGFSGQQSAFGPLSV